ncbi:MAG: PD40 domain-containing protein [Bacteroidetes bacterium]|nr:PD40 domain-containing protein [Bacteroidota bacterium]
MKKFAIFLVILSFIFLFFSVISRFANRSDTETEPESTHYLNAKKSPPEDESLLSKRAEFLISEAEIFPLEQLNSAYFERNLTLTTEGNTMYFMSNRGEQPWSSQYTTFKGKPIYDGDIWVSQKVDGEWQWPSVLPPTINTSSGEDEPNISPDGTRLYFQSWNRSTEWENENGPYYFVENMDGQWQEKQALGGNIAQFFKSNSATDGMSISRNEDLIVWTVGNDYDGNMDLYFSRKDSAGWSKLAKLNLNTPKDERSVFLSDDGKTLYFASDGFPENSFGGMDIYKTTIESDGSTGEIINIGQPFNTEKDESGFVLSGDLTTAYFIREGDIFQANIIKAAPEILP